MVPPSSPRARAATMLLALVALLFACMTPPAPSSGAASRPCSGPGSAFELPSYTGLNYGTPPTVGGEYIGTEWLRSGTGTHDHWDQARAGLQLDLDFIAKQNLGRVIRIFVGLDQLMVWDSDTGFARFDDQMLTNYRQAMDMVAAHRMKAIVVLYDQENQNSLGNFRFIALDGYHGKMRANYLRATSLFLSRFGSDPDVVGWDLFNEAYNSLGRAGGLAAPPHADPVSPGYPQETVHNWLRDLYRAAKCSAPRAWFTVSDTTDLYWKHPLTLNAYADVVDFYDIHIYDDSPHLPDWRNLHAPLILGEVGAAIAGNHYLDQGLDASAVGYLLRHGRQAGASAVLAHASDHMLYARDRSRLTDTGTVVSTFAG